METQMKLVKIIVIALFIALSTGCRDKNNLNKEELTRPVKLYTVVDGSEQLIRIFPAQVDANKGTLLAFRVEGQLIDINVLSGQDVKINHVLASLDPNRFQLHLDDTKARYELANSQLDRSKSLVKGGLVSRAEFDQISANVEVAKAALQHAKNDLENTKLRAPFDGVVSKLFVKNFENIQAKQNILRLENRDLIDVVIQVPERIVAQLNENFGYQPEVIFDGIPNRSYKLDLKEWDTLANERTGSYRVVFTMQTPKDFNLFAGMSGVVKVDLRKIIDTASVSIFVPVESIFYDDLKNDTFVWKFSPSSQLVNKVAVTVGRIKGDKIEVSSGIKTDDIIVAAGIHLIDEGMKVRPYTREEGL